MSCLSESPLSFTAAPSDFSPSVTAGILRLVGSLQTLPLQSSAIPFQPADYFGDVKFFCNNSGEYGLSLLIFAVTNALGVGAARQPELV